VVNSPDISPYSGHGMMNEMVWASPVNGRKTALDAFGFDKWF